MSDERAETTVRIEHLESAVADIAGAYEDLTDVLEKLTAAADAGPPPAGEDQPETNTSSAPAEYSSWAEQADAEAWEALMDWADWFMDTYQRGEPSLMGCWARHPGVVEDVAALKLAWEQAVAACAKNGWRGEEALEYWHDRYLPGFFHRVRALHGMSRCQSGHDDVRGRRIVSDRDGAVAAATGEPVR